MATWRAGGHISGTTPITKLPMAPLGPAPGARSHVIDSPGMADGYVPPSASMSPQMANVPQEAPPRPEWIEVPGADGPVAVFNDFWDTHDYRERIDESGAIMQRVILEHAARRAEERQRTRASVHIARFWVKFGRGMALHGAAFGQVLVVVLGLAATLAIWVF